MSGFGRKARPEPVFLNLYDLSPYTPMLDVVGMGVYHSGVEVHGTEYTFGSGGGIFSHAPKQAGAPFRTRLRLGDVSASSKEVERIVDGMRGDWPGHTYSLLRKNCNSFSDALARQLLGAGIPSYVNRISAVGQAFACLLPQSMTGEGQGAPVSDGGGGGGGGGRGGGGGGGGSSSAVSSGRGPGAAKMVGAGGGSSSSSFGGAGRRLGEERPSAGGGGGGAGAAEGGTGLSAGLGLTRLASGLGALAGIGIGGAGAGGAGGAGGAAAGASGPLSDAARRELALQAAMRRTGAGAGASSSVMGAAAAASAAAGASSGAAGAGYAALHSVELSGADGGEGEVAEGAALLPGGAAAAAGGSGGGGVFSKRAGAGRI